MPTPSLLIVPARFKTGKMYSQIPTSGAGDFTVTRATSATRVNASGLIESVASGIPRLDYFASGGVVGCPALLVEPSAQNLAWHSETWASGSNWQLSDGGTSRVTRVSGSTDAFKAPDGTFTANAISPTSGDVQHYLFSNSPTTIAYTSGTIYTQSAFFKAGGTNLPVSGSAGRYVQLTFNGTTFTQLGFANFDLQLGTVAVVSGSSADTNRAASIENYGNGWYRCRLTATCTSSGSTTGLNLVLITTSGDIRRPSFAGTVTDVLYGWGAQFETGSVATSYIPTTTGSVTRNADVVSVSGAVSGSIGQTEGTFYLDLTVLSKGSSSAARWLQIFGASNNIGLAMNSSNQFRSIVNAQSDTLLTAPLISSGVKVAWAYDGTGTTCFINGTQYTLTTGGNQTMSSLTSISIDGSANTAFGFARIRAAALYNTRLTNAQLAALTTP